MVSVEAEGALEGAAKAEGEGWEEVVVKAEKAALDLESAEIASARNVATLHHIRGVTRVIR